MFSAHTHTHQVNKKEAISYRFSVTFSMDLPYNSLLSELSLPLYPYTTATRKREESFEGAQQLLLLFLLSLLTNTKMFHSNGHTAKREMGKQVLRFH